MSPVSQLTTAPTPAAEVSVLDPVMGAGVLPAAHVPTSVPLVAVMVSPEPGTLMVVEIGRALPSVANAVRMAATSGGVLDPIACSK